MAFSQVTGLDLYIGGIFGLPQIIEDAKITHVVSLVKLDQFMKLFHLDPDLLAKKQIKHLSIPEPDRPEVNLIRHFHQTNQFIKSALDEGGNVLVHCGAGISRSATICIAYLLHTNPTKLTPESAVAWMRRSRPTCEPNEGFMAQLELYHRMGCPLDPTGHELYHEWVGQGYRDKASDL